MDKDGAEFDETDLPADSSSMRLWFNNVYYIYADNIDVLYKINDFLDGDAVGLEEERILYCWSEEDEKWVYAQERLDKLKDEIDCITSAFATLIDCKGIV